MHPIHKPHQLKYDKITIGDNTQIYNYTKNTRQGMNNSLLLPNIKFHHQYQ